MPRKRKASTTGRPKRKRKKKARSSKAIEKKKAALPFKNAAFAAEAPFVGSLARTFLKPSTYTTLVYADAAAVAVAAASSNGNYVFDLNACYDPDSTGTGHQPYPYDQWTTFYGRYQVVNAEYFVKIECISSRGTNTTQGLYGGVQVKLSTGTNANSLADLSEFPHCQVDVLQFADERGGAGSTVEFTGKWFAREWFEKGDDSTIAATGADPTSLVQLSCKCGSTSALTAEVKYIVYVQIRYRVKFMDPIPPDQS